MASRYEVYPRSVLTGGSPSPWPSGVFSGDELDLRAELQRTLYGAPDETPKGRTGLLRVMRLDSDGNPTKCPCRDTITDEPDKDFYCRVCLGMGFLWDERKIVYYRDDDSKSKKDEVYFYLEHTDNPARWDYIIELKLDGDGSVIEPEERDLFYKIEYAEAFRSDRGRIEYWRCRTTLERKWSVWYGNASRQHEPTTRSE